ncbi:MAG: hypothetical protein JW860_00580 [Sedimentisphaerales bacterium]|nr:hypothetical protein [Sedimentisphaerales bacterium]
MTRQCVVGLVGLALLGLLIYPINAQDETDRDPLLDDINTLLGVSPESEPEPVEQESPELLMEFFGWHGFWEVRGGYRVLNDPYQKDMSIMETRFQLDLGALVDIYELRFKGDAIGDLVLEEGDFDLREGNVAFSPLDFMDIKVGRQILTWGTGDLLFINDMFPKDWQSFFIGRDVEYLKAPSDAAKVSLFSDWVNLDVVYTPQFDPDRYISGERISFYCPMVGGFCGQENYMNSDRPNRWFKDSEFAWRLYRNIDNYEMALYGYKGYWKSPAGSDDCAEVQFPDLNVYGASLRGNVGKGIGNVEVGYYQSRENESGNNPFIRNSEIRFMAGYTRELAKDFTAGVQYYLEHTMDWDNLKDNLPIQMPLKDRNRHVITLRLTQLLLNQNLRLGIFTYYSPGDKDAYLRPNANYKLSDNITLEAGANIFFGDYPHTFFSQFHRNTNIYTSLRYSF